MRPPDITPALLPVSPACWAARFALSTMLFTCAATRISAQVTQAAVRDLGATTWQLVRFQGGDGAVRTPDDRAKYTIAFGSDARVSARIDCNRGSGTWKSAGLNQLEFGPLTLTRVKCPAESLHDQIVRHWPFVRTYTMRNGHLFLSLMADGGIYDFEPVRSQGTGARSIQGTAAYRERIQLPANAALVVTLEDVPQAGARAEVIARVRNERPGNPPIPFTVAFDAGRIKPNRRYSVRARILVDEKLWFATDQNYPVLTAGQGSSVQLLLRRVGAPSPPAPAPGRPSAASLEDTYWKLIIVGNESVRAAPNQREPHFILHPANKRMTGSGGCNQFSGSYEVTGNRISLGQIVATKIACTEGMQTETQYLQALDKANRWRISGQRLELLDAAGRVIARFEAVHMR